MTRQTLIDGIPLLCAYIMADRIIQHTMTKLVVKMDDLDGPIEEVAEIEKKIMGFSLLRAYINAPDSAQMVVKNRLFEAGYTYSINNSRGIKGVLDLVGIADVLDIND